MSDENNTGPAPEWLKGMAAALPGMAKAIREGKIIGRGTPVTLPRPTKYCEVCGVAFDKKSMPVADQTPPEAGRCPICTSMAEDGCIALTCDNEYVWFKFTDGHLADLAGQVVKVPPHIMKQLVEMHELELKQKTININFNEQQPPDGGSETR